MRLEKAQQGHRHSSCARILDRLKHLPESGMRVVQADQGGQDHQMRRAAGRGGISRYDSNVRRGGRSVDWEPDTAGLTNACSGSGRQETDAAMTEGAQAGSSSDPPTCLVAAAVRGGTKSSAVVFALQYVGREEKRSHISEEDMDVGEMVEHGFGQTSGVIPMRVHMVRLDGAGGDRAHHTHECKQTGPRATKTSQGGRGRVHVVPLAFQQWRLIPPAVGSDGGEVAWAPRARHRNTRVLTTSTSGRAVSLHIPLSAMAARRRALSRATRSARPTTSLWGYSDKNNSDLVQQHVVEGTGQHVSATVDESSEEEESAKDISMAACADSGGCGGSGADMEDLDLRRMLIELAGEQADMLEGLRDLSARL